MSAERPAARSLLCRLGRHGWFISVVNIAGHQSYRERCCRRCGIVQRQKRGYGGDIGAPWESKR